MSVFEHLNEPLAAVKNFHETLNPGGLLFFDYIKGEGDGCYTMHAVRERSDVLGHIAEHFEVLHGTISNDKSMGLTIVRRR